MILLEIDDRGDCFVFRKKEKTSRPAFDITQKVVKTWWGGTKTVPTTRTEQKMLKAKILQVYPETTILDKTAKKNKDLEWIDRLEELDALLSD